MYPLSYSEFTETQGVGFSILCSGRSTTPQGQCFRESEPDVTNATPKAPFWRQSERAILKSKWLKI